MTDPDDTRYELPSEITGWTGTRLQLSAAGAGMHEERIIPDYTHGDNGLIELTLDEDKVVALVDNSTGSSGDDGAAADDLTTALAAGLAAPYSATFDIEDRDGYTATISITGNLDPFTSEVADSLPGKFEAVTTATIHGTATNTTNGRNARVTDINVIALYNEGSAMCNRNGISRHGDDWQDSSFCSIPLGSLNDVELEPDSQADLGGGEVPASVGGLDEDSDALEQLNAPIAIYARFGADAMATAIANATSTTGCDTSGFYVNKMWYVPMDAWPDPICS